ncbi:DUF2577 family protein [Acidaminobacter sp. JC074]|uniref:DUF2577 family protein n=1 Tax=Acidaminobacter sp. JC074 TaxID=2530199 RepID=UPI001F0E2775|nr:DUF2577 family protein [Acidaminobacter sp. JC074]
MSEIVALALEFKKRDPKKILGPVVGKVVKPMPDLQVTILSGQVVISAESLYITEKLYKDSYDMPVTGDLTIDDLVKSIEGNIRLEVEVLKVGELVMLVPAGNGQEYFIIDRVRKAK